jgi:hypothetical protein
MCDRDDLETERLHVMRKARLDDLGRINPPFLEISETFLMAAADGAENLKIVCDSRVIERKGHGVSFPRCVYRVRQLFDEIDALNRKRIYKQVPNKPAEA